MSYTKRKNRQVTFVLLISKCTQVKDSTKIEKQLAKRVKMTNSQLFNLNRPQFIGKQSPLDQQVESAVKLFGS